ncbi:MAG TPA: hypothetical protein VJT15_07490 [Pyrinomonadaceae bacterium]|nr:hypothetical protein [Pyrinomonadaceae bacterium]
MEYLRAEQRELQVHLPGETLMLGQIDDRTLREMVRHGIERARSYGITWESTLTSFVAIMFLVAPGFDENSHVKQVLGNQEMAADLRVDELLSVISEDTWAEVKRGYDVNAWSWRTV